MRKEDARAGLIYRSDHETWTLVLSVTDRYERQEEASGRTRGYPVLVASDPTLLADFTLEQFTTEPDTDDPLPEDVTRLCLPSFKGLHGKGCTDDEVRVLIARETVQTIKGGLEEFTETVVDSLITAYQRDDWKLLSHPSWEAYLHAEFGEQLRVLTGLADVMIQLREKAQMPTRAIAAVTGKSHETVRKVIKEAEQATGKSLADGGKVKSADGRHRPSSRPAPKSAPPATATATATATKPQPTGDIPAPRTSPEQTSAPASSSISAAASGEFKKADLRKDLGVIADNIHKMIHTLAVLRGRGWIPAVRDLGRTVSTLRGRPQIGQAGLKTAGLYPCVPRA